MIATRTDDVDDHRQTVLHVQAALAHRARRADDLIHALAFEGKRRQQRGGLHRRKARVHDFADERGRLVCREVLAAEHPPQ